MGIITKPIPVALQRRAAELPCDGIKRYRVGKRDGLTYSEAYAAIRADGDLGPNDKGGRILKRGVVKRLAELNRLYFRVASTFVVRAVQEAQEKQKARALDPKANAPQTQEEIDDGGAVGTAITATGTVEPEPTISTTNGLDNIPVGDKMLVVDNLTEDLLGRISRNKSGFRLVWSGNEIRSRNPVKMASLIDSTFGARWVLMPVAPVAK